MKISSSNKLTIILLLKERKGFTKRFFIYISKINFPYKIIIADGSRNKLSKNILNILKTANINYNYYKFSEDKNYNLFLNKIYKSLTYVKTKYIMLFSDDDFPIVCSIERLIKFLDRNNKYIGAGGYLINFDLYQKKTQNKKNETYGIPINFSKFYNQRSFNKKNRFDRLKFYLTEGKESGWHNIYRKKAILESYKKSRNIKFKNNFFSDWMVDSLIFIGGKIKKINVPTLLHQYHSLSEINKRPTYSMIKNNKNYIEDKKYFLLILKRYMPKKKQQITKIFNIFFQKKEEIKKKYSNNLTLKKIITNLLPLFLEKKIINFYKILLNYYLYLNNFHFKYFLKNFFSKKDSQITKNELLFFFNFINK